MIMLFHGYGRIHKTRSSMSVTRFDMYHAARFGFVTKYRDSNLRFGQRYTGSRCQMTYMRNFYRRK
jgi:hypothetical protein